MVPSLFLPCVLSVSLLAPVLAAGAGDRDGDGLTDEQEEVLGTSPDIPDRLTRAIDDGEESASSRKRPQYDATKDLLHADFGHSAENRYLWRATFAVAPRLEDMVLHFYVDADADEATGRQGPKGAASTGTEYMLSVVGGAARCTAYQSDGSSGSGPFVSFVVSGNSVIISADVDLAREAGSVRASLYVLAHTLTKERKGSIMSDSTGKHRLPTVELSAAKKILRPMDYRSSVGVSATCNLQAIRKLLRSDAVLEVPHDRLELDGFVVDLQTYRRFPHVRREKLGGRVSTRAPRAGRYHIGFMIYDDSNDERVGIRVDDKLLGLAIVNQDDNRTWLYWTREPLTLRGDERIELEGLGPGGKHGIVNILFLAEPPAAEEVPFEVRYLVTAAPVDHPGRAIVSWTTSRPSVTRFEYGSGDTFDKVIEEENRCLVHRVILDGLSADMQYRGRPIGVRPDGSTYAGSAVTIQARRAAPPATSPETQTVPLTVRNPHPQAAAQWPITVGVPFPQGKLGSVDHVRLMCNRKEIPLQIRPTCAWPDGSVKWILITFLADVAADGTQTYELEFGRQVRRPAPQSQLAAQRKGKQVTVNTGVLQFTVNEHGNIGGVCCDRNGDGRFGADERVLTADKTCGTVMRGSDGTTYRTDHGPAELVVEESGPLRVVIRTVGWACNEHGERLLRIEQRIAAFAGSAFLHVWHTFINDRPEEFTNLEELSFCVPSAEKHWQAQTAEGQAIDLEGKLTAVRQRFDHELVTGKSGTESPAKGRLTGTLTPATGAGPLLAIRDAWQQYPKGFQCANGEVRLALCPDFAAGVYDRFPFEKEGHQLYYYLLEGRYRFKHGMSKTHELLLGFGPASQHEAIGRLFQRPLLATPPPEWNCNSQAFYRVAPRDRKRFAAYEKAIDANIQRYAERRERQHDYGLMNYGDWYGERGTNWGNIEYDTQHAFFLEYVRSGNPQAFFLGEAAETHNRDIDTLAWSSNPGQIGAVYVHQMCHVGGYYTRSVPGSLGFPRGGYTVSHAWVEGHFDHYFLTGDRRSRDTGMAVADFFIRKDLGRPYDFSSTRVPGWHLIMNAAAYAATNDPYYLNASRVIVDRVLETQDVEPRPLPDYQREPGRDHQVGGWSRMMVPGHCHCEPRHRGNAGFMVAILLSGLKYFHDVTGDERVKECIIRGARYLLDETYSDEVAGFRYTSCPKTSYRAGASPLMVEGIARAYLWTKDERFRRVLTEALPKAAGGSSYGKGFSMYYRCAPRVLADLAEAGLTLEGK